MESFIYTANPGRVLFGAGMLGTLPEEVDRLGCRRVVVLSTPGQRSAAAALAERLGDRACGVFAGAVMHTPVEVTQEALAYVTALAADGVVSLGGGSTIGLGKAIALRTDLPQIVIPTTYAGSEMTPILGETSLGVKTTRSGPEILPEVVLYDVELTLTLPPNLTATSGLNAVAHAVEALYARDRNPVVSLMAMEGLSKLIAGLPVLKREPLNLAARSEALYGAWLCGACLGAVGMALHHKLCHTLGGSFDLPHAETHAVVLPHALAYNAPAIPEVMARLRPILGPDPARGLYDLAGKLGVPQALQALGMPQQGVEEAARRAVTNAYWNPRPLDAQLIQALIARAWSGEPPKME